MKKHLEFMGFSIELPVLKEKKDEEGNDGDYPKIKKVDQEKETDEKKKRTNKVTEVLHEWDQQCKNKPVWMCKLEGVTKRRVRNFPKVVVERFGVSAICEAFQR